MDVMRKIFPADRDLTPPDRRRKCLHGVPLSVTCPACLKGRLRAEALLGDLDAEIAALQGSAKASS